MFHNSPVREDTIKSVAALLDYLKDLSSILSDPIKLDELVKAVSAKNEDTRQREEALKDQILKLNNDRAALEVFVTEENAKIDAVKVLLDKEIKERHDACDEEIKAKLEEIQAKFAELDDHHAKLDAARTELDAMQSDIETREASLKSAHADLDARTAALDDREAHLNTWRDQLTERHKVVSELESKAI